MKNNRLIQYIKANWLLITALTLCAFGALLFYAFGFRYYGTFFRGQDAQEYYVQVRSAIIDGDLDYTNEFQELIPSRHDVFYDKEGNFIYAVTPEGRPMNKATAGWAIVTLPAFLLAHAAAYIGGFPPNGYSLPYDVICSLWHVSLAFVGFLTIAHVLRRLTSDLAAAVAVVAGFFATNLPYYTSVYPLKNHAASFGLVSLLLYCAYRLYLEPKRQSLWIWTGILTLLFVLVRPPNAVLLVVLAPASWSLVSEFFHDRRTWRQLFLVWPVVTAIVMSAVLQMLVWSLSYGYWVTSSYGEEGEGFTNWLKPFLWKILFSTQHGAWYYHPIYLIGAIGFIVAILTRHTPHRPLWIAITVAALLHLYVNASWFRWTSGHSFGNRRFIDVAPLMLYGVGFLLYALKQGWKLKTGIAVVLVLCVWNVGLLAGTILDYLPVAAVDVFPRDLLHAQWQTFMHILGR